VLALGDRFQHQLAGDAGAADEFHDHVDARVAHDLMRIVGDLDVGAHERAHPRHVAHGDADHLDVAAGAPADLFPVREQHFGNTAANGAVAQQADTDRPQARLERRRHR
jgi:hypothetical protein